MDDTYHHHSRRPNPPPSRHAQPPQFNRPQNYPPDSFFRPPYHGHGLPHEYLPRMLPGGPGPGPAGPGLGGPHHPHPPFGSWANPSFPVSPNLPPPPPHHAAPPTISTHSSSAPPHPHPPPHMNFMGLHQHQSLYSMGSGGAGGGNGGRGEMGVIPGHTPHSGGGFPHPPPPHPPEFNHQMNSTTGNKFRGLEMKFNHQHYRPPNEDHSNDGSFLDRIKGELQAQQRAEGGRSGESKFPLLNGMDAFKFQAGSTVGGSEQGVSSEGGTHTHEQRIKRLKTGSNFTKHRSPKRPLVEVNKEVKVRNSMVLSVVSYNLLAQDLLDKNMFLYTHCSPDHLHWDFRKNNLLKDLTQSSADILCLQEVQSDHYHRWYQPQLTKHGYTGLFKRRTGSYSDGCAIFYRDSKLKLLQWKGLEYYQKKVKVLNRDNVAVLAKFAVVDKSKEESAMFCVANTHLLFNPKAGEVKLAQLSFLLAELHKMAVKPGTRDLLPVLLCGDFNSTPNSPLLQFLTKSNLDYSSLSAITVAGYYEGDARTRVIPTPLLPLEMNIGQDCVYRPQEGTMGGDKGKNPGNGVGRDGTKSGDSLENPHTKRDQQTRTSNENEDTVKSSVHVTGRRTARASGKEAQGTNGIKESVNQVTGQSEFTMDVDVSSETVPTRTVRSIRGARSRGSSGRASYSGLNFSEDRSLLGSSSTTKRGRGGDQSGYLSVDDHKSTPALSDTSSLDEFVVDRPTSGKSEPSSSSGCHARGGLVENGTCDSLESSMSSITGAKHDSTAAAKASEAAEGGPRAEERGKGGHSKKTGPGGGAENRMLTHPFKLMSTYPISKSYPSIITTYHQCAFEAVDYMFFSPITCCNDGTDKKRLTGFNLLKRKVLPSTHTLLDLGPQPHGYLSSDHLLLQATYQFSW